VAKKIPVHSIRKSFLSALYGIHAAEGHIDLGKTLGEIGIDDRPPALTAAEKQATIWICYARGQASITNQR
jgi:hypothetical protein